ncbi:hypothetical protein BOTBODRAFT_178103 [Botryobasidium botryosum FD-172 SS1]|uniref:Uncharacterized protein n=1 Tax=Botryobasidium botryosum (strain FD-172 SS1) TaxID=930990 RepID=A0A067M4G6_BOTB1|nr:hypothetical protein BOTBODRAFT_178103 [Botryobasidium botryosum FD-172 SS1]
MVGGSDDGGEEGGDEEGDGDGDGDSDGDVPARHCPHSLHFTSSPLILAARHRSALSLPARPPSALLVASATQPSLALRAHRLPSKYPAAFSCGLFFPPDLFPSRVYESLVPDSRTFLFSVVALFPLGIALRVVVSPPFYSPVVAALIAGCFLLRSTSTSPPMFDLPSDSDEAELLGYGVRLGGSPSPSPPRPPTPPLRKSTCRPKSLQRRKPAPTPAASSTPAPAPAASPTPAPAPAASPTPASAPAACSTPAPARTPAPFPIPAPAPTPAPNRPAQHRKTVEVLLSPRRPSVYRGARSARTVRDMNVLGPGEAITPSFQPIKKKRPKRDSNRKKSGSRRNWKFTTEQDTWVQEKLDLFIARIESKDRSAATWWRTIVAPEYFKLWPLPPDKSLPEEVEAFVVWAQNYPHRASTKQKAGDGKSVIRLEQPRKITALKLFSEDCPEVLTRKDEILSEWDAKSHRLAGNRGCAWQHAAQEYWEKLTAAEKDEYESRAKAAHEGEIDEAKKAGNIPLFAPTVSKFFQDLRRNMPWMTAQIMAVVDAGEGDIETISVMFQPPDYKDFASWNKKKYDQMLQNFTAYAKDGFKYHNLNIPNKDRVISVRPLLPDPGSSTPEEFTSALTKYIEDTWAFVRMGCDDSDSLDWKKLVDKPEAFLTPSSLPDNFEFKDHPSNMFSLDVAHLYRHIYRFQPSNPRVFDFLPCYYEAASGLATPHPSNKDPTVIQKGVDSTTKEPGSQDQNEDNVLSIDVMDKSVVAEEGAPPKRPRPRPRSKTISEPPVSVDTPRQTRSQAANSKETKLEKNGSLPRSSAGKPASSQFRGENEADEDLSIFGDEYDQEYQDFDFLGGGDDDDDHQPHDDGNADMEDANLNALDLTIGGLEAGLEKLILEDEDVAGDDIAEEVNEDDMVDPGSVAAAAAAIAGGVNHEDEDLDDDRGEDGYGEDRYGDDDMPHDERTEDSGEASIPGSTLEELLIDEHRIANAYIEALKHASLDDENLPPKVLERL